MQPQLPRDDLGTAELKSCEKPVLEGGGGSSDSLRSAGVKTQAGAPTEEAKGVPGVIGGEHEVTKKWFLYPCTLQESILNLMLIHTVVARDFRSFVKTFNFVLDFMPIHTVQVQ